MKYPDFKILTDAMERLEPGAGYRGGSMQYKHVADFEKIRPEEGVIYHATNYLDSQYAGEQVKFIVIMLGRKTPKKLNPHTNKGGAVE